MRTTIFLLLAINVPLLLIVSGNDVWPFPATVRDVLILIGGTAFWAIAIVLGLVWLRDTWRSK